MFGHKILIRCFFIIFSLLLTPYGSASDSDSDEAYDAFRNEHNNQASFQNGGGPESILLHIEGPNETIDKNTRQDHLTKTKIKILETYYEPATATKSRYQKTFRQVLVGSGSIFASYVAVQVGIPLFMGGLKALGVTRSVLPPDSPLSYLVIALAAVAPLVVVNTAAYTAGSSWGTTEHGRAFEEAEEVATTRPYSYLETASYSMPTKTFAFLFFLTTTYAIIQDLQWGLDETKWGSSLYWALGFSICVALPILYTYVLSIMNPNENPNYTYGNEEDNRRTMDFLEMLNSAEDVIEREGLIPEVKELAQHMQIIHAPLTLPTSKNQRALINNNLEKENIGSDINFPIKASIDAEQFMDNSLSSVPSTEISDDERHLSSHNSLRSFNLSELTTTDQPIFLRTFALLDCIAQKQPENWLWWKETTKPVAKWSSNIVQGLGVFSKDVMLYAFLYSALRFYNVPVEPSIIVSSLAVIGALVPLASHAYSECAITYEEYRNALVLYSRKGISGSIKAFGTRLVVSLYLGTYMLDYLREKLLIERKIGPYYQGAQAFCTPIFLAGTWLSAPAQAVEKYLSKFFGWCSQGMPIDFEGPNERLTFKGKLLSYFDIDSDNDRKYVSDILDRVKDLNHKTKKLNSDHLNFIISNLPSMKDLSESKSLLAKNSK